jgi:hypothetical protein
VDERELMGVLKSTAELVPVYIGGMGQEGMGNEMKRRTFSLARFCRYALPAGVCSHS